MMRNNGKIVLAGILGGFLSLGMFKLFDNEKNQIVVHKNIVEQGTSQNDYQSNKVSFNSNALSIPEGTHNFTKAAEKTINSVVHVTTQYQSTYSSDPFLDFFWGPGGSRGARPQVATGSGVIISEDGYIVTNNHVIDDADKIEITLNDERNYKAKLIGADPSTDLALVKIEEKGLPYLNFGNSDDVKIGEWVLAVGNPFNLTSTVTAGIVSAKSRSINLMSRNYQEDIFPLESFIQTDAAVNPGNSGGALVTADGQLIGINTAIASRTGSYSGYSFAIPSNIVKKITEDLLEYGVAQRAFIGVSIENIDQKKADELALMNVKGVLVNAVSPDGAAKSSGIEVNDVILKIGSIEVNNVPELQEQIGKFRPGDNVSVTIRRGREEKTVNVVLRNKEGNTKVLKKGEVTGLTALGAVFKRVPAEELKELGIENGVKVASISGGKLRSAGITEGFIITDLDQKPVESPEKVVEFFNNKKGGVLVEGIYPNGMKGYFGFGL